MENIPFYVYATFGLTLITTIYLFYRATQKSKGFIILIAVWVAVQSMMGIGGFYTITNTMPPRFQLLLLPPLVFTIVQLSTRRGRVFMDSLNLKVLTIIHTARMPVELVLYWLSISKAIPELMTFEGRNFDIVAGLTAPIIYYFVFVRKKWGKSVLIAWNLLSLALLINIIINGILSAPTPFQQFAFEQPNLAVLHFPFLLLPACIVPLILFAHIASIRQLLLNKSAANQLQY
jgi:hypothetical protein